MLCKAIRDGLGPVLGELYYGKDWDTLFQVNYLVSCKYYKNLNSKFTSVSLQQEVPNTAMSPPATSLGLVPRDIDSDILDALSDLTKVNTSSIIIRNLNPDLYTKVIEIHCFFQYIHVLKCWLYCFLFSSLKGTFCETL